MTASLFTCLRRNRGRADAIDERAVHIIYREFDAPDADLTVNTDDLSLTAAVTRIERAVREWLGA